MDQTIPLSKKEKLFSSLQQANTAFQKIYPGDRSERQPVHTLYGGANLFKHDSARTLGERALEILETYAPDHKVFGEVFGFNSPCPVAASSNTSPISVALAAFSTNVFNRSTASS